MWTESNSVKNTNKSPDKPFRMKTIDNYFRKTSSSLNSQQKLNSNTGNIQSDKCNDNVLSQDMFDNSSDQEYMEAHSSLYVNRSNSSKDKINRSKVNTTVILNSSKHKENSEISSSSDESDSQVNTSASLNSSKQKICRESSSSSDEETKSKLNTSVNSNSSKQNKYKGSSSIYEQAQSKLESVEDRNSPTDRKKLKNISLEESKSERRVKNLNSSKTRSSSESLSDDNEFNFKNKSIGKLLGLAEVGSCRNMSLTVTKEMSKNSANIKNDMSPKKKDEYMEESENNSSSSDDECENTIIDRTHFVPSASSSFMANSTPNPSRKHLLNMTLIDSVSKNQEPRTIEKTSIKSKHLSRESSGEERTKVKIRCTTVSEDVTMKKINVNNEIRSDFTTEICTRTVSDGSDDVRVKNDSEAERPEWMKKIVKNKRQVNAEEKLGVDNCICFEDINSDDEMYSLQCPKELNIESLIGKKISLKGESLFEGITRENQTKAYETFAVNVSSNINLLLPSKLDSTFKLGGYKVKGSVVVSERYQIAEMDINPYMSTGMESGSEDEHNTSTPLPSGLKLRHPLHGLNYKKRAIPNFDAVFSQEKKHKKNNNKQENWTNLESDVDSSKEERKKKQKTDYSEMVLQETDQSEERKASKKKKLNDKILEEMMREAELSLGITSFLPTSEPGHSSKKHKKEKKREKSNPEEEHNLIYEEEIQPEIKKKKKIKMEEEYN